MKETKPAPTPQPVYLQILVTGHREVAGVLETLLRRYELPELATREATAEAVAVRTLDYVRAFPDAKLVSVHVSHSTQPFQRFEGGAQ